MQKYRIIELVNQKVVVSLAKAMAMDDLPFKAKYRLNKQAELIAPAGKAFNDLQNAGMKKHGTKQMNDKGKWTGKYEFEAETIEAFNEEMKKHADEEIEILDKIEWPKDGDEKPKYSMRLNAGDIAALAPFFTFEEVA